ncbi:MAG: hypothetical protein JNK11_02120 [Alphaproteobacteria bacterium]|nr:hypothetical protein [Alphaproteobacteria bacterium]
MRATASYRPGPGPQPMAQAHSAAAPAVQAPQPSAHPVALESIIFSLPADLARRLDAARGAMSRADTVCAIMTALLRGTARIAQPTAPGAHPGQGAPHAGRAAGNVSPHDVGAIAEDAIDPPRERLPESDVPHDGPLAERHAVRQAGRGARAAGSRAAVWVVLVLSLALAGSGALHIRAMQDANAKILAIGDLQDAVARARAESDQALLKMKAMERELAVVKGRASSQAEPRNGGGTETAERGEKTAERAAKAPPRKPRS